MAIDNTLRRALLALAAGALLLGGCTPLSRWSFREEAGPPAPFGSSSLLGEPGADLAPEPTSEPAPTATPVPQPVEPLTLLQAQECLDGGQTLYGLALQNTNVRQAADLDACRIGRIPKGTLVRITGARESGAAGLLNAGMPRPRTGSALAAAAGLENSAPAASAPAAAATAVPAPVAAAPGPSIGFHEDVLPIFERTCSACHSGVVKNKELQVTAYAPLMQGSSSGVVVVPGDPAGSILWQQIESDRMPLIGKLSDADKAIVRQWIEGGAPEQRPQPLPAQVDVVEPAAAMVDPVTAEVASRQWLDVEPEDIDSVADVCGAPAAEPLHVVSSELILPVACETAPDAAGLNLLRASLALPGAASVAAAAPAAAAPAQAAAPAADETAESQPAGAITDTAAATENAATESAAPPAEPAPVAAASPGSLGAASTGITAPAWGLPAPSDADAWMTPRGGLCIERRLPENDRGITALAFAPDGRLFLAFDSKLTGEADPMILYDAYHPSRAIAVVDSNSMQGLSEILAESTRITGLDWEGGALYISRAGEVGRIPDGGGYETLASGFAVNSRLFHANNGLAIAGGWLYVSAGGVMDGYSEGPITGIDEASAQQIVSGGNPYAARIVRAPLDALLAQRSISAFSTAGWGVRNPYGIAADPGGRIWFTDNGATNVPDAISAGDEVDVLNPGSIGGGGDGSTPYFGFPLALTQAQAWYAPPAVSLPNSAAPTGIAWALGTIYFAQYGRDPGLYRVGVGPDALLVAERVLPGWPILALGAAPDGALWIGMGDGGLYRIGAGC